MEVGESTLKHLIEGEKQFQVPLFQRQYTWEVPQLTELWDDILDQYDALTPDGGTEVQVPLHFLGSVVLAPSPAMHAEGVTHFVVIDGQQRLTTLLLALSGMRDHIAADRPELIERFNDRYLVNKYGAGISRFRLLPTQADRHAYRACVDRDDSSAVTGNIARAYQFFRSRLMLPGPDNEPLDLGRLEAAISLRLQFIVVTAGAGDNVHRIFESLNDRGMRLTQADLLRNYVFMLLPNHAERVYEELWHPMERVLSSAELESFFFVDMISRGQATLRRFEIYRAQQERLRPVEHDEGGVEAEVRELARRASLFQRIVRPSCEEDSDVRSALVRLDRWGAATAHPLILYLLDLRERRRCSPVEVAEALAYVESFLGRRMIAGIPTNNLNRIFYALVSQLSPDLPVADAVRRDLSERRKYWPSDSQLRDAIRTRPFYFQGRQAQKMLVFRRLEESYGHAEPIDWDGANLSIEHVMPQSLSEEWRKDLEATGDDPEAVHSELLHTLGNLTVTAYNGMLSNDPFERKAQILQDSHLELNKAIAPQSGWGKVEILARGDELWEHAKRIWPGPLPGVEEPEVGRDWSNLHAALAAMPHGTWTSYSDCAELIGSHQVPVGQHLATTPGVLNAHRVLTSEGKVSPGFRWTDTNDTRGIHEVLRSEGVHFDGQMRASQAGRLRAADLADLVGEAEVPSVNESRHDWRMQRLLRYLQHFYEADRGRLPQEEARRLAVEEGYDPRGVAGFYQGTASLRVEGEFRVLTDMGRQLYEENRHRIA